MGKQCDERFGLVLRNSCISTMMHFETLL